MKQMTKLDEFKEWRNAHQKVVDAAEDTAKHVRYRSSDNSGLDITDEIVQDRRRRISIYDQRISELENETPA